MDKYGRKFAAVPASVVMAVAMYLLALADGFVQLASVGALFGVGNAMTSGISHPLRKLKLPPQLTDCVN